MLRCLYNARMVGGLPTGRKAWRAPSRGRTCSTQKFDRDQVVGSLDDENTVTPIGSSWRTWTSGALSSPAPPDPASPIWPARSATRLAGTASQAATTASPGCSTGEPLDEPGVGAVCTGEGQLVQAAVIHECRLGDSGAGVWPRQAPNRHPRRVGREKPIRCSVSRDGACVVWDTSAVTKTTGGHRAATLAGQQSKSRQRQRPTS